MNLGNVDNTSDVNKPISTATQTALNSKLDISTFNDLFEKVDLGGGVYAIKAKYDFYSIGNVSAYGAGSGSSGGSGLIQNVYDYNDLGDTYDNATLTDTFNAYTINQINNRLTAVESNNPNTGVYELALGNPSTNGYLLSSTTAGVRSWIAPYSLPTASASVLGGVKIGTNVTISNGVISVHNPVTIDLANGLSLSTQALSLALATTSANGALSSTDKTYIELLKTFFEWDATNSAIKAKYDFYSTGEVSAYGYGASGSGGGSTVVWEIESAGAVPLTVEGVTKTLSLASHTHTFASLTNKPTTLAGYGITAGLTTNYLTKWNGTTIVNSSIFDNGTNVGIGTATPSKPLTIQNNSATIRLQAANDPSGYFTDITGRYSAAEPFDISINNYGVVMAVGTPSGYSGVSIPYMNGYYGSALLGRGKFGVFVDPDGNVGIGTTTPTATLDVNGIGKFKDDILMTFNTWSYNNWTYPTDKNSLKKFLNLFDIDTEGNLVVKTNLYSTGEVTAYSTGTGVSGLTLQGDMNANGKNINNVGLISAGGIDRQVILQEDTTNYPGSGIFCTW